MTSKIYTLLLDPGGRLGRLGFLFVELVRGVLLGVCYGLFSLDHDVATVVAATLFWAAMWPGIVGTVKRFRDLKLQPVLILPVLMYLSGGFAAGVVLHAPVIGFVTLGLYLAIVLGVPSRHHP